MQFFWLQQLPFLILLQILESSGALISAKSTVGSSRQFDSRAWRSQSLSEWDCVNSHKVKGLGGLCVSSKLKIAAVVDGDPDVPTLTPVQVADVKKSNKQKVVGVIGGVVAAVIVIIIGLLVYFCLMRLKRLIRRASDEESSVPSPSIDQEIAYTSAGADAGAGALSVFNSKSLKQLTFVELKHATGNFGHNNIIGQGGFGLVYKGLLYDGSIMAIKRRVHFPVQYFVQEVKNIARVHHKHVVSLIGYCEENHEQLLVYEYLLYGNVGNHLYDGDGSPIGDLDMKQRLIIALGAAKGLEHLHSLVPPVFHMRFRTRNVLVGDNFTAKVSDFGHSKFLVEANHASSSSAFDCFLDPELRSSKDFSEKSDVYSFGVFLLELISGREAVSRCQSNVQENLVWQMSLETDNTFLTMTAKNLRSLDNFVDKTVGDHSQHAVKQMMELAMICVDIGVRRPTMENVVQELERIQAREIGHLHSDHIQEISNVTLGIELFK